MYFGLILARLCSSGFFPDHGLSLYSVTIQQRETSGTSLGKLPRRAPYFSLKLLWKHTSSSQINASSSEDSRKVLIALRWLAKHATLRATRGPGGASGL